MDQQTLVIGTALVASVLSALLATLARRVMQAGVWLAATSAALATALYFTGAPYVAAIEVSVGAGLVAVLIVFTVADDVDDGLHGTPILRPLLAGALAIVTIIFLALFVAMGPPASIGTEATATSGQSFAEVFWQERGLDVVAQLALLFVAAVSVVMLVGSYVLPSNAPAPPVDASERPAREREEVRL